MAQPNPCTGGRTENPHPGLLWGEQQPSDRTVLCVLCVQLQDVPLLDYEGVRRGLLCGDLWHHGLPSEQVCFNQPQWPLRRDFIASVLPFWEEERRS